MEPGLQLEVALGVREPCLGVVGQPGHVPQPVGTCLGAMPTGSLVPTHQDWEPLLAIWEMLGQEEPGKGMMWGGGAMGQCGVLWEGSRCFVLRCVPEDSPVARQCPGCS